MTASVLDSARSAETCYLCGQRDADHKTHLMANEISGGLGWAGSAHLDCLAMAGHVKSQVMAHALSGGDIKNIPTGQDLLAMITDPAHPVHLAVTEHTHREAATSHYMNRVDQGYPTPTADELVEWLAATNPNPTPSFLEHVANLAGMQMSSTKQGRATNFLNVEFGSGSFTARTGAVVLELDSAVGSQSAAGTPLTGGSYADQTCAFGSATTQTGTYSGQIANSGTPTFTNSPALTVTSITLKDSAGTPVQLAYGLLTASKALNAGDTVAAAPGNITSSI